MNKLTIASAPEELRKLTLENLFSIAEKFGRVGIYSSTERPPPARYRCTIIFDSIPGTSVEASSEFGLTIEDALIQSIERAESIVEIYARERGGVVRR